MRYLLFWDVTRRRFVVIYRFGTFGTSFNNYQYSLRNTAEERRSIIYIYITKKYTLMIMMYFIHNVFTNMFRPMWRPSSGWYYYKNTKVHLITFVPSYSFNNIISMKIAVTAAETSWRQFSEQTTPLTLKWILWVMYIITLRTRSFKLFKRPFPGFLTILTL